MGAAEEHAKAIISQFQTETLARIEQASEEGQKQILRFVEDYIASLQFELPLSIKQVLNKGGQVRQLVLTDKDKLAGYSLTDHIEADFGCGSFNRRESFYFEQVIRARVTIIVEPIE